MPEPAPLSIQPAPIRTRDRPTSSSSSRISCVFFVTFVCARESAPSWSWVAGIIGPWHTAEAFWRTYGEKVRDVRPGGWTVGARIRAGCPRGAAGVPEGDGRREPQNHPVLGRGVVVGNRPDLRA